jgi:hypothetical protein
MFRCKRSLAWWWQNPVPGSLPHIFHQMRMLPLVLRLRGSLWYLRAAPAGLHSENRAQGLRSLEYSHRGSRFESHAGIG